MLEGLAEIRSQGCEMEKKCQRGGLGAAEAADEVQKQAFRSLLWFTSTSAGLFHNLHVSDAVTGMPGELWEPRIRVL